MEDIKLNIMNGNWKDAIRGIRNSNLSFDVVMESIMNDEFLGPDDAITLLKIAIYHGYVEINHNYED